MKIAVTGGAGLIGSHLVDELMKWGHTVWILDNLSGGEIDNISPKARGNFYKVDLRNKDATDLVIRQIKPEVVYHCAAWAQENLAQFTPRLITENNINIFLNTIIPAIRSGMRKFIFFSSIAAYGHQEPPFTEDMDLKPVDIYGINKSAIESMVKVLSSVHDFSYSIVRPHNVYGPRQSLTDPYRNVIGIWMNQLLKDEGFYIYGDGEQRRAFSYIGDILPPLSKLVADAKTDGETYNLGADREYSLNELSQTLLNITKKKIIITHLPDRPAEVKVAYSSHEKARRELGLADKTSLRDGLSMMWEWAKTKGPQEYRYLDYIELPSEKMPRNWRK